MLDQIAFGERLKNHRKARSLTQEEAAEKLGVSAQAVSKWEKGDCLPDVYNLKLLGLLYRVSLDDLLNMQDAGGEKVVETIKVGNAVFDVVERPSTILAGKMLYAKDYRSGKSFFDAMGAVNDSDRQPIFDAVTDCVIPVFNIHMSVNFWLPIKMRAFGFVRETTNASQPVGVDVYQMPASLFIRTYTNRDTAQLIAKEQCGIWELFAYIRNHLMPANGFKMADNGAQEMEIFDTAEYTTGYAYMPVRRA